MTVDKDAAATIAADNSPGKRPLAESCLHGTDSHQRTDGQWADRSPRPDRGIRAGSDPARLVCHAGRLRRSTWAGHALGPR